jgi:hypothetical protein
MTAVELVGVERADDVAAYLESLGAGMLAEFLCPSGGTSVLRNGRRRFAADQANIGFARAIHPREGNTQHLDAAVLRRAQQA